MDKSDFKKKFDEFEDRQDVKDTMRIFTAVLANMYEKNGLTIPSNQAYDKLLNEFEIDTTDVQKQKLRAENERLQAEINLLKDEKDSLTMLLSNERKKN